jgi:hypothetical protein
MKIVVSSNFYAFVLLSFHLQYIQFHPCQMYIIKLSNSWISLVLKHHLGKLISICIQKVSKNL